MDTCAFCPNPIPNSLPGEHINCVYRKQPGNSYFTQHEVCKPCYDKEQKDRADYRHLQSMIDWMVKQQDGLSKSLDIEIKRWRRYEKAILKIDRAKQTFTSKPLKHS